MDQGGVQMTSLGDLIGSWWVWDGSAWCREQDYLPAVSLPACPISMSSEYPLGTCSLGALCSSLLQYHMRIHKEERKYLCPDCGYKCKWVNQLKYHMTKHTGESVWFSQARGVPLCRGTPSLPECGVCPFAYLGCISVFTSGVVGQLKGQTNFNPLKAYENRER